MWYWLLYSSTLRRWRNGQVVEFWGAHNAAIQSVIKLPSGELVTGTTANMHWGLIWVIIWISLSPTLPLYIMVSNFWGLSLWLSLDRATFMLCFKPYDFDAIYILEGFRIIGLPFTLRIIRYIYTKLVRETQFWWPLIRKHQTS